MIKVSSDIFFERYVNFLKDRKKCRLIPREIHRVETYMERYVNRKIIETHISMIGQLHKVDKQMNIVSLKLIKNAEMLVCTNTIVSRR